jgi:hypothetical protein
MNRDFLYKLENCLAKHDPLCSSGPLQAITLIYWLSAWKVFYHGYMCCCHLSVVFEACSCVRIRY